jgi:hypothetical protein
MNIKKFISHHHPNRPCTIAIGAEYICFYFGGGDIENDDPSYWIGVSEWKDKRRRFSEHMEKKSWFISDMRRFINDTLAIPDPGTPARFDTCD